MDLIQEQHRRLSVQLAPVGGALDHRAHLGAAGLHGAQLLEGRPRALGDDPRERRLARPGRPVEDHRVRPPLFDRRAQRRARGQQVRLPDELLQAPRARPRRQRSRLAAGPSRRRGSPRPDLARRACPRGQYRASRWRSHRPSAAGGASRRASNVYIRVRLVIEAHPLPEGRAGDERRREPSCCPREAPGSSCWTPGGDIAARSPLQLFWRRLRRDRVAMASLAFIVFLIVVAIAAPLVVSCSACPGRTSRTPT